MHLHSLSVGFGFEICRFYVCMRKEGESGEGDLETSPEIESK